MAPEELSPRIDRLADIVEGLRVAISHRTRWILGTVAAVAVAVAIPIMVNRVAVNHARDDARDNSRAIQVLLYTQCTDRNATLTRQNALIDRAIAAELRRPKPSPVALKSLRDFKGTLSNCGPRP